MAIKAGTAFVELVLNDQPYKQRLSETLTNTEATARGIETSWRALGTKSAETFDAQRRAAENAYTLISKSALTAKDDIIRAEEAKNAKITQFNEQQFGKQTSLIDTLKQNWIAASAAIYGAWALVGKGMEYVDLGAKAIQAEESFRRVAESAGESADEILAAMKKASAGTIDESDIMQKAVKGMVLGLEGNQLVKIMEAARISARVTGEDVKTAYENITDAIATGMPKALKRYGLITKEEMALVNAALKAGVQDVDLYKIAMLNAEIQAAKFGEVQVNLSEKVQISHARIKEFHEYIGTTAATVYGTLIDWVQRTRQAMKEAADDEQGIYISSMEQANKKIAKSSEETAIDLANAELEKQWTLEEIKNQMEAAAAAKKAAQEKEQATKSILEVIRKAAVEIEGIGQTAYEKDLFRIEAEAEKFRAVKVDEVNIAKFVELEKALAVKKRLDYIATQEAGWIEFSLKENVEYWAGIGKGYDEDQKKWTDGLKYKEDKDREWIEFSEKEHDEYWKAMAEEEKKARNTAEKNATDRIKMESDMYKDIRGYATKAYDAEIDLINDRARKAKDLGVSEVAIATWVAEETRKATLKKVAQEDDFFAGVKAGFADLEATQYRWGQAGIDTVKALNSAMSSTLGGFFTDVFKGQCKSAEDYFNTFKDAIIASFSQMVAKMATDWLMLNALKAGEAGWSWLTAEKGMWEVPGGKNGEVPIVGHEGEMILPKTVATGVRNYFQGGDFSGAVGTGVGAGVGAYVGGKIGQWIGGYFGKEGGQYGGMIGNVAGAKAGAMAGQSVAAYLAGTNAGVATTGVEAGMTATEAYGAGVMGGETSAGAVAGAEGGSAAVAGVPAALPAFAVFTAAMIAYGMYDLFTRKAESTNPFAKYEGNEAKKYAPLDPIGEVALERAGAPFSEYYNISGNGKYTDPIFYQTWGPAYESIRHNPYFTVEGAWQKWWEHAGRNPTKEEMTSDTVYNWYRQNPEYYGGINAARNELYPGFRSPYAGENWMQQFRPPPNYQVGTNYVPETGFAMLHKGERVIPANENAASNQEITINVNQPIYLDGRKIADNQYKLSRRGIKTTHTRGVTAV